MLDLRNDRTFTVENTETGEYRTFRVELRPEWQRWAPGQRVLELLKGPENQSDYGGFAFVHVDPINGHPRVKVWSSKRGESGARSAYEKIARLLEAVSRENPKIARYAILDALPCQRCGELLTRPDSIRKGIGPVCAKRAA